MKSLREPKAIYEVEPEEGETDQEPDVILRTVDSFGFAKMSHLLTFDRELSDEAYRLYGVLLYHSRQKGQLNAGEEKLAEELHVSRRTISQRLSELVERGLITREQRLGMSALTYVEDLGTVYNTRDKGLLPASARKAAR